MERRGVEGFWVGRDFGEGWKRVWEALVAASSDHLISCASQIPAGSEAKAASERRSKLLN